MMHEGEIVHYEIPAKNPIKLRRFYSDVLGWKFKASMPGMKYMVISTNVASKLPSGGMYKKSAPKQSPTAYVAVKNIDVSTKRLQKSGGKILVGKQAIPNMGWSVVARDPEGNMLGLFQSDMKAGKS
jgi:hypothetical protein